MTGPTTDGLRVCHQTQPLTDAQRRAIVADVLRVIEWPMREADYAVIAMLADMGDPEATPEAEAAHLVEAAADYAWDHLLGEPANPKPKAIAAEYRRRRGGQAMSTPTTHRPKRPTRKGAGAPTPTPTPIPTCDACGRPAPVRHRLSYRVAGRAALAQVCPDCRAAGDPPTDDALRALIAEIRAECPGWGYRRIAGVISTEYQPVNTKRVRRLMGQSPYATAKPEGDQA